MAKTAVKASKSNDRQMRVTVYFGYGLFLLTFLALVLSAIPWLRFYEIEGVKYLNITMLLISFVFTALAPPLIGYFAGDGATRAKSKLVHHYNGVLFGVLGVWVWLVATMLSTYTQFLIPISTTFENTLLILSPAIIAALVTITLATYYARSARHQGLLIDYKPYRWALIISATTLILSVGASALMTIDYGNDLAMSLLINLVTPAAFVLAAVVAGYWILGRAGGTRGERLTRSLVAVGFSIVGLTLFGQLVSLITQWQPISIFYGIGFVAIVWLTYLLLLRRALVKH